MVRIDAESGELRSCACGCGGTFRTVIKYGSSGQVQVRSYLPNHHRRGKTFGCFRGAHLAAITSPTSFQIVLAAGWFEGEGWAGGMQVEIAQKDKWMVDRLVEWFGGRIYTRADPAKPPYKSKGPIHIWCITGPRARGFLFTIYQFLSPRRKEQALRCIRSHQSKYLSEDGKPLLLPGT